MSATILDAFEYALTQGYAGTQAEFTELMSLALKYEKTTRKDLGRVTAYGYAKSKGYTGTEEEFAELMASYATVAEEAADSASEAEGYAEDSQEWSVESEAWATGQRNGVDVDSEDETYHNNSKYYAEQAQDSADAAAEIAATFTTDTGLTIAGKAADAKATGDRLAGIAAAVGSPLVITDPDDFDNASHTRVYVYAGTTTSLYTNGDWYYWDGDGWESGGVYNSVALDTDETLSVAGAAADAAAVGEVVDDVTDLKSAINSLGTVPEILSEQEEESDLDFSDSEGNVIIRLSEGELSTKGFNSKKSPVSKTVVNDFDADFYLSDESGNGLIRIFDGHIQTKNFNSDRSIYKKAFSYNNTSGTVSITRFFPEGTELYFHLASTAIFGSDSIAKILVTYTYTDELGDSHSLGQDYGYNYFKIVLPENAIAVSASYSSNMLWGSSGYITFSVFTESSLDRKPIIVTLGNGEGYDYQSLRTAVDDIAPDASDVTPYEIHIYPGTYDVLSDYTDDEISAEGFIGLMISNGISLIGEGKREQIVITSSLDENEYSAEKRNDISTLNVRGNTIFKNITITAENIRYAVHEDYAEMRKNVKRYENVKMRGYTLTTGDISYGAGHGGNKTVYFKNCDFSGTMLIHNATAPPVPLCVYIEDCVARKFSFPDYNATTAPSKVYMKNCKSVFIEIGQVDAPHDQSMFVYGEGDSDVMVRCPIGYVYNIGGCIKVDNNSIPAGYAVKFDSSLWHNNLSVAKSLDRIYGISIGTEDGGTIVQTKGYISSRTLNMNGLSVGDYLTIDTSTGAVVSGGTASNAIAKVKFVDEQSIAFAKLMI